MKAKEEEDFILGRTGNWNGSCNTDFLYGFDLKAAASCMKRLSIPVDRCFWRSRSLLLLCAPHSHDLSDKGLFISCPQMEKCWVGFLSVPSRVSLGAALSNPATM